VSSGSKAMILPKAFQAFMLAAPATCSTTQGPPGPDARIENIN
jgi:hypothetical protein